MAGLNIPKNHFKALKALLGLPEETTDKFLSSLSGIIISVQFDKLTKTIASHLKVLDVVPSEGAAEALVSLYATRAHSGVPIPAFVDDVLDALVEHEPDDIDAKQEHYAERLTRLLSFEPLSTAAKAMQLLSDQERLFFDARILTDARPVYSGDPNIPPVGMVINQTLRITYLQDGNQTDFYVAVDSQDISKLRDILERAQLKGESLKKIFESAKIPVIRS